MRSNEVSSSSSSSSLSSSCGQSVRRATCMCFAAVCARPRGGVTEGTQEGGSEARKADKKTRHMPPALRPHRVHRRAMSKIAETAYTQAPCAPAVAGVQIARRCKMSVADFASARVCMNIVIYTHTHIHTCIRTYIHTCIHTYISISYAAALWRAKKEAEVSERQLADTDPHNDAWNCFEAAPDGEPEAEGARNLCI